MTTRTHSPTGLPTRLWTGSLDDSEHLAMRIRNYWAVRGYKIETGVYGLSELGEKYPDGSHIYSIRSNMVGGLPPRDPSAPVITAPAKSQKAHNPHPLVRA